MICVTVFHEFGTVCITFTQVGLSKHRRINGVAGMRSSCQPVQGKLAWLPEWLAQIQCPAIPARPCETSSAS